MTSHGRMIRDFAKRIYKLSFGKDLNRQKDYVREDYDNLVEDIVSEVPIKCPIYECGGTLKTVIRKMPKDFEEGENYPDGYDGDDQTPDMVCDNCNGKYKFDGFKKRRGAKE